MKKQSVIIAAAAGLAVLLAQQQSYAQYGNDNGGVGVSDATLQKCQQLQIPTNQCSDHEVLLKERVNWFTDSQGSGTPIFAKESGQMILLIGTLGAVFGGVAAGFFVMGKKAKKLAAA